MIEDEMVRLGKILAADQGITVECRGSVAYATPGGIVLPAIEHFAYLGADAERMLHGLLDHEAGHAVDTDWTVIETLAHALRPVKDGPVCPAARVRKEMHNAVDDGYIEGRRATIYRGVAHNLKRKNLWFWTRKDPTDEQARTVAERIAEATSPFAVITVAVTLAARAHGGQSIEAIASVNPEVGKLLRLVEADIEEIGTLYGMPREASGARVLAITDRILATLTEEAKRRGEPLCVGAAGTVPEAMAAGGPGSGPMTPEEAVLIEIKAVLSKDEETRPYMVFSHEYDVEESWDDAAPVKGFRQEEEHAAGAADALTGTFEAGLRARRDRQRVAGWDEGDVAPELLAEWSAGAIPSDEIYEQLISIDDRAVAVGVLLDCSGSMSGGPALLARRTAIAMHRALATCQIAHEITGFATIYSGDASGIRHRGHDWLSPARAKEVTASFARARLHLQEAQDRGVDVTAFARIVATGETLTDESELCAPIYGVFKAFGSEDPRNLMRITGTTANLDGEAIMWAARRLAKRPEPRRVMFVLSDGLPSGSRSSNQGSRYLRESVKRCVDAGIEIYGIGMKSTEVRNFYPQSWVAHSMSELTEVALGALVAALAVNRQEHAEVHL